MNSKLQFLFLEDNPRDVELVRATLDSADFDFKLIHAANQQQFETVIANDRFDLILADFTLPNYDGFSALAFARLKIPAVPFIFLSGTLGEEMAIESLKTGATDYVLKQRLSRLIPAVRRALQEAQERTKHREAEDRIREHAALLDKTRDAIVVTDLECRILYWNKGAEIMYGWSAADALGQNAGKLLFNQPSLALAQGSNQLLERGEWTGELEQVTNEGKSVTVESRWTLLCDSRGSPKSILVVNTDITEKKKLQAQFLRNQRVETIGALADGIAHDLNNILAPIIMAAELLRPKISAIDDLDLVDILEASARRGAGMVKQVLAFARGIQGEPGSIQPRHLLFEIKAMISETFPPSIEINHNIASDLWCTMGDGTQIYQVLMNLCVNARDAMPNGGILSLEAQNVLVDEPMARLYPQARQGPYIALTVSDTGTGIPPECLPRIFDTFFTTKPPGKGTGLGLSTVLGIVKAHGGFIVVSTEPGKGTQFRIHFPKYAQPESQPAGSQEAAPPIGQGELVLLVDDEQALREIGKATLEQFGYQVCTATDGADAVRVFLKHKDKINAVITDLLMPLMDGAIALAAMKRLKPQTKFIVCTGAGENLDANHNSANLNALGVQRILLKPYKTSELLRALDELLHPDRCRDYEPAIMTRAA